VLEELENAGVVNNIKKVGGTSAGAIIALAISLGYNSGELKQLIYNTEFKKFNDGRFIFFGGFNRLNKYFGWYRGDQFNKWVSAVINEKTGDPEMTFMDLHNKGYKDLYLTATCLNKQKLVILSRETYPNMKIRDAVRISMSIPVYFKAVFIDSTGNVIKKPGRRTDLDIMVDGGIIANYPIDLFDTFTTDSLQNKTRIINPETIGVRIDSELQIKNDNNTRELVPLKITNLKEYIGAFYIFVLENLNRNKLTAEDWQRTISVSSVDIGPRIKKLSAAQKESLIISGRRSTIDFIKK
jgi:NTE family protein